MEIKIYTTEGCRYCEQLKELFRRANIAEYTEFGREQLKNDYPEASTFPQVIIDGERVGGLVETAKMFVEKGIVSARKNG